MQVGCKMAERNQQGDDVAGRAGVLGSRARNVGARFRWALSGGHTPTAARTAWPSSLDNQKPRGPLSTQTAVLNEDSYSTRSSLRCTEPITLSMSAANAGTIVGQRLTGHSRPGRAPAGVFALCGMVKTLLGRVVLPTDLLAHLPCLSEQPHHA